MGEVLDRNTEGSSQAEISQFEQAFPINQQILRLQVSMEHLVPMAFLYAIQELV